MWFRMIYWRLIRRPRPVTSQLSDPKPPAISARTASRDTSSPAAVASADQDDRGSLRLLVAAALLRRGDDIGRVAALTGVRVALCELVREHSDQGTGEQAASTDGISEPGGRRGAQDDRIGQQLELGRRRQARGRHAITVLVLTEVATVGSALAGVAGALGFAVFLVTRIRAWRGPGRPRSPHAMNSSTRPSADPSRKRSP